MCISMFGSHFLGTYLLFLYNNFALLSIRFVLFLFNFCVLIQELDPFPDLDCFENIRKFHQDLCLGHTPTNEFIKVLSLILYKCSISTNNLFALWGVCILCHWSYIILSISSLSKGHPVCHNNYVSGGMSC